jgi:mRNA interferase RelE/StbE
MSHRVEIVAPARRVLPRLPRDLRDQIRAAIRGLANDPRPHGCCQVVSRPGYWRVRVRGWRVIYGIDDAAQVVTVVEIMPRQDDYRQR